MKNLLSMARYSDTYSIEFWGNDEYENFHSIDLIANVDGQRVFVEPCDALKAAHRKAITESIPKNMVVIFE